jgi:hypothetical protein
LEQGSLDHQGKVIMVVFNLDPLIKMLEVEAERVVLVEMEMA